jgi:hypothetical protein
MNQLGSDPGLFLAVFDKLDKAVPQYWFVDHLRSLTELKTCRV